MGVAGHVASRPLRAGFVPGEGALGRRAPAARAAGAQAGGRRRCGAFRKAGRRCGGSREDGCGRRGCRGWLGGGLWLFSGEVRGVWAEGCRELRVTQLVPARVRIPGRAADPEASSPAEAAGLTPARLVPSLPSIRRVRVAVRVSRRRPLPLRPGRCAASAVH